MATLGDPSYDLRVSISDPSENKERALGVVLVQQFDQAVYAHIHPTRIAFPLASIYVFLEGGNLEILLNIDCEVV